MRAFVKLPLFQGHRCRDKHSPAEAFTVVVAFSLGRFEVFFGTVSSCGSFCHDVSLLLGSRP